LGNFLATPWELDGNTLETGKKKKRKIPPHPTNPKSKE
jgi:hypothetical protein